MMKDSKLTAEELDNDTRPQLRLIPGGKDGGGFGENWLNELEVGTIFLARVKGDKNLILNNYMLARRSNTGMSTNLRWVTPDDRVIDLWVPTLEWSRANQLHEIIGTILNFKEQEEKGDTDDGSGAIFDTGFSDDVESETGHSVDAEERKPGE